MKLRVYLASPHKFDEAVEFGFPSTEQPNSPTSPPKRVDSLPRNTDRGAGLRMQTLVEDKRPSGSRPGEGVVSMRHTARNQDDVVVAVAVRKTLVRMAPDA